MPLPYEKHEYTYEDYLSCPEDERFDIHMQGLDGSATAQRMILRYSQGYGFQVPIQQSEKRAIKQTYMDFIFSVTREE